LVFFFEFRFDGSTGLGLGSGSDLLKLYSKGLRPLLKRVLKKLRESIKSQETTLNITETNVARSLN